MSYAKPYPYVVAIIQARLGSHRFPRKMLADLGGMTMMEYVINRVRQAKTVHQVVVATPDEELHELAYQSGVWGFKEPNDPDNVLARYLKCAAWCDAEIVVRITGDCPLIDPQIIDLCVKGFLEHRCDISTNVLHRTFVKGFDVEVLHRNVLKRIFHLTTDANYREHVTLYAYHNPGLFVWNEVLLNGDFSEYNVSVDTPDDLDLVRQFLSSVGDSVHFSHAEVLDWLRASTPSYSHKERLLK
jgi:spore coat polysaccharide biosynthesis protein SpsF